MAYEENKNSSINMDIAVVVKVKKGYAIKTAADILMGKREAGGVFIGKDNYLIDTFSEYDKKIFNKNIKNMAEFRKKLAENKISCRELSCQPGKAYQ